MTNDNATTSDHDNDDGGPGFPAWMKWGLIGALVILVLGYGAIFLYAKVLNDSPDELDTDDRAAALAAAADGDDTDSDDVVDPTDTRPGEDADGDTTGSEGQDATESAPEPAPATEAPAAGAAEEWVINPASELGYRVKEVLFGVDTEGVGRTNAVVGSILIDGTTVIGGEFIVDVATIASDDGRRDGQFRGRIMSTDEFPEAVFTLTEPIELGTEVADGASVITTATGELTLRGVTNTVTFEVDATLTDGLIGVLGNIPVVFEDYGIDNPSFGGITTEDNGLLEFVLVFERA